MNYQQTFYQYLAKKQFVNDLLVSFSHSEEMLQVLKFISRNNVARMTEPLAENRVKKFLHATDINVILKTAFQLKLYKLVANIIMSGACNESSFDVLKELFDNTDDATITNILITKLNTFNPDFAKNYDANTLLFKMIRTNDHDLILWALSVHPGASFEQVFEKMFREPCVSAATIEYIMENYKFIIPSVNGISLSGEGIHAKDKFILYNKLFPKKIIAEEYIEYIYEEAVAYSNLELFCEIMEICKPNIERIPEYMANCLGTELFDFLQTYANKNITKLGEDWINYCNINTLLNFVCDPPKNISVIQFMATFNSLNAILKPKLNVKQWKYIKNSIPFLFKRSKLVPNLEDVIAKMEIVFDKHDFITACLNNNYEFADYLIRQNPDKYEIQVIPVENSHNDFQIVMFKVKDSKKEADNYAPMCDISENSNIVSYLVTRCFFA